MEQISYEKLRRRSLGIFTITSIIAISFVGILVGTQIAREVREQMIQSYSVSAATQVGGIVNSFVTLQDLQEPFRGAKYDKFLERVTRAVEGTNVVNVKLWRTDGTVVFSNDKEIVGKRFTDKEHLAEALGGRPSYEISDLKADDNYRQRSEFNHLLEMYYPVYLNKNKPAEVSAVYEVYISALPLERHVGSVMRTLAIGLSGLILALIVLAQVTSHMLRQRNDRLAEMTAELGARADTDGLTGLFNHRHFQSFIGKALAASKRYDRKLGLIILDIDFFKDVNDRYGHQVGDLVLKKVAAIFSEVLRDSDYAARYGGEEFVAVLPETGAHGAVQLAEHLRETAENLLIEESGGTEPPRVTLSCGVADFPDCADTREGLIAAADSALLFAKQNGRNRVYYFRDISRAEFRKGDLEKLGSRLQHVGLPTVQALVAAVDTPDSHTGGRVRELGPFAQMIGEKLNLREDTQKSLALAAQVHDAGNVTTPDRASGKTEALTAMESEAIRSHPEAGAKIVESAAQMESLLGAVLCLHENWDGSGHPNGLSGMQIPYLARILRIVDAYEAMLAKRPHNANLAPEDAIVELREKAGREFDPEIVEILVEACRGVNR